MKLIRKKANFVSLFMITLMLSITVPYQPLLASMVQTEAIIESINAGEARDYLKSLISRDDIAALTPEAAAISGIQYILDCDAAEVENILKS